MRKLEVDTIVVIKQDLPHFGLKKGEVGRIAELYKEQNVYDIYFFKRNETRRLSCNLVRRIAAKDLPTNDVLLFLSRNPDKWHNWCFDDDLNVCQVFEEYVPQKVILAKMSSLMSQKLIDGCDCGCRGDYEIMPKGLLQIGMIEEETEKEKETLVKQIREMIVAQILAINKNVFDKKYFKFGAYADLFIKKSYTTTLEVLLNYVDKDCDKRFFTQKHREEVAKYVRDKRLPTEVEVQRFIFFKQLKAI